MTNSFLTIEDINGALYNNQQFWWWEFDSWLLGEKEYTDIKYDFCRISLEKQNTFFKYKYTIKIDNPIWTGGYYILTKDYVSLSKDIIEVSSNKLVVAVNQPIRLWLYMGVIPFSQTTEMGSFLINDTFSLNLKQLKETLVILARHRLGIRWGGNTYVYPVSQKLDRGYNLIHGSFASDSYNIGYLYVNLLKTNFEFNCSQSLTLGKVNTVQLGADADYKLNGAMIDDNLPTINVLYNDTYIPVQFDSTVDDYVFKLDLTSKQIEGKVKFNVIIEANDVLNATETEVVLDSSFETINNESKLITLFNNGGIGRLGANIPLTKDIQLKQDVLLIGNSKTINMQNHKIIVPSDKTFKAEKTVFNNGRNTIQQHIGSIVHLTDCGFNGCTGFGSVIDCQTDLASLSVENDFITNITDCVFANNDMCILHGGELNVTGCEVTGKIGNPSNPYFLYQTDGEATILQSHFRLSSETQIETDIEFNTCIFTCGETAMVNGNNHEELQKNNINTFISNPQSNTSRINVTYYYPAIEDYITLQSNNGYCHACSGIDFVFKSNVTARRE